MTINKPKVGVGPDPFMAPPLYIFGEFTDLSVESGNVYYL